MPQKNPCYKSLRSTSYLPPQEISAAYLNFYPCVIATEKNHFLKRYVYSSIVASVKTLFLKFRFGPLDAACRKMFFSKKVAHIPLLLGDITQNAGTQ